MLLQLWELVCKTFDLDEFIVSIKISRSSRTFYVSRLLDRDKIPGCNWVLNYSPISRFSPLQGVAFWDEKGKWLTCEINPPRSLSSQPECTH